MTNKLYYGDNLEVLRDEKAFPDESGAGADASKHVLLDIEAGTNPSLL